MDANLIISVAVLIGTLVLIWLTILMVVTKKPTFRLYQLRMDPYGPFGIARQVGDEMPVSLVFVNDGPGVATGATAYVTGAFRDVHTPVKYPAEGSPTVPIGGTFEIPLNLRAIERPAHLSQREYSHGDDYFFDLEKVVVRFEWGIEGKRRSKTVTDLHSLQQHASPQGVPVPDGWMAEREARENPKRGIHDISRQPPRPED